MQNLKRKFSNLDTGKLIGSAIFFAAFAAFIYLWVDSKIIYHTNGMLRPLQIAVLGVENFISAPATPSAAIDHVAAVLAHFYYFSWATTLILTLIAWLLCLTTEKVISAFGYQSLQRLKFLPAILLAALFGRFCYQLSSYLSLLTAMVLINIYLALPLKNNSLKMIVALLFSTISYFAGIEAYFVFVTLCMTLEFIKNRNWLFCLSYAVFAAAIVYLADIFYFDWGLTDILINRQSFFKTNDTIEIALMLSFVLVVPALGLICVIYSLLHRKPDAHKKIKTKKQTSYLRQTLNNRNVQTAILFLAAAAIVFFTAGTNARRALRISYFASQKMFDQLLKEAKNLPPEQKSILISHDINRALYHTGRLLDEMFCYPQYVQCLMLNYDDKRSPADKVLSYLRRADTVYELGYINQAEDAALDSLTIAGYHPASLKMLAMVNIIKKQPDAAKVFLNALSKDFLYKKWAMDHLKRMEADPLLSGDPEIIKMRSFMPTEDIPNQNASGGDLITLNKKNKMAFEYRIAYCLLNGQPETAIQAIELLDDLGYPKGKLPKHLEEAVLVQDFKTRKKTDLHSRTIRPETIRQFEEFIMLSNQYIPSGPDVTKKELAKKFGNTFYYYFSFAESGLAK